LWMVILEEIQFGCYQFSTCEWKSFWGNPVLMFPNPLWKPISDCYQFSTCEWKSRSAVSNSIVETHFWLLPIQYLWMEIQVCCFQLHCGNPFLIVTNSVLVNGNPWRKSISELMFPNPSWKPISDCYQFCACKANKKIKMLELVNLLLHMNIIMVPLNCREVTSCNIARKLIHKQLNVLRSTDFWDFQ
jgi:hypothetical protein